MKLSLRLTLAVAGLAFIGLSGAKLLGQADTKGKATQGKGATQTKAAAEAKAPASGKPTAGEVFKNVTTPTLKVLSPDDFILTMGLIADNLGLDCADCHPGAGSDKVDWVIDTPQKKTARKMIEMVGTINKTNFAGVQMVTCWTCHHGRDIPATTVALDSVYSNPNSERDDIVKPQAGQSATAILGSCAG